MNKQFITAMLAIAIVFQVSVLAAEYIGAVLPLWTGKEIRLKTTPVDPRSLFRGNYARLDYAISTVNRIEMGDREKLRAGEIVYVRLRQDEDGLHVYDGAGLEKPESGPFIRGRLQRARGSSNYPIRYGIEAYFAPKQKAISLESRLLNGGVAVVMVSDSGKATLKDVQPEQD